MLKRIFAAAICLIMGVTSMVYTEASAASTIEAPQNLTVELKHYPDEYPYFELKFEVPPAVQTLYNSIIQQDEDMFYETEYKVGNGEWTQAGSILLSTGTTFAMNPDDMGIDGDIDIKANVYYFRVKFGYYTSAGTDEYGNAIAGDLVSSSFSNVASTKIDAKYENASSWATEELDRAAEYGFITESIAAKMNAPITREEFCEVIMKLYEKMVGEAAYTNLTTFTDTVNPEIYKAYELGIVGGIGNGKFAPKDLINREQVASMIYRAIKVIQPAADFTIIGSEKFTDENLISSWALESVKFMNKNGFIKGSNGRIDPKGTTTREQAVLIVLRTYEKYKN